MERMMLALLFAASAGGQDVVAQARAALARGDFAAVMELMPTGGEGKPEEAGEVLSRASAQALAAGDEPLASLYCQLAARRMPDARAVLDACTRAAMAEDRGDDAARYSDRLGALAPGDLEVALLRARVALAERRFERARDVLTPFAGKPGVKPLLEQAEGELKGRKDTLEQQKALEVRLAKALAEARELKAKEGEGGEEARPVVQVEQGVVLYTTRWCGYCQRGRAWLKKKGIRFKEKDVETDSEAATELQLRCSEAGVSCSGVPVLYAQGKVLLGFDEREWAGALR